MAALTLYLIRHGIAAERGDEWPDDSKRPLTGDGIAQLRKAAKALDALGITFDQIITSPLVRTRQTADALASHMAGKTEVTLSDALAPAGTTASVIQDLTKPPRKGHIALVGHEPNMGELAARLIGSRVPLPFKKGAICCIEFDTLPPKGSGQLRWFVTPKMLRKIG